MANILVISQISYKDFNVYGIKGIGEDYKNFYNLLNTSFNKKYKTILDGDSFWHYIGFLTPEYDAEFRQHEKICPFIEISTWEYTDKPFKLSDWK